jgi:hypothetical protein
VLLTSVVRSLLRPATQQVSRMLEASPVPGRGKYALLAPRCFRSDAVHLIALSVDGVADAAEEFQHSTQRLPAGE